MRINKETKKIVALIADIADFGIEHTRHDDDVSADHPYRRGGYETVGHTVACCISQWITHDSEGTSDVCEALRLDEFPPRKKIEKQLLKYLKGRK